MAQISTSVTDTLNTSAGEKSNFLQSLPFDIHGSVDAYYQHSFAETPAPTSFTDTEDGFSLGMGNLMLSREGKVGFMLDLAFGPRADAANGFTTGSTLAAVKQIYLTYSPWDWINLTAGNFSTFIGYELITPADNINYSMSYLFSNGPFYHTGIKADVALGEKFGLMVGLFNDTDNKFDFTSGKHIGAQLSYAEGNFAVYLNYLHGKSIEGDTLLPDTYVNQLDLVATLQATEKLALGLNITDKINTVAEGGEDTNWFGAALYANYTFSELFTLGFRGEYLGDKDGLILGATDGSVIDLTLSGNFHVGPMIFIPEFRLDLANEEVFTGEDGKATNAIPSFLLAAIYAF